MAYTIALQKDGTVWAWGYGQDGQLGNGNNSSSRVPVRVTGLTNIVAIAAGDRTGYALRADGTVWAWGSGSAGQLGNGLQCTKNEVPVRVDGLSNVREIAAGGVTGYALGEDGQVLAWGSNYRGAIGNGESSPFRNQYPDCSIADEKDVLKPVAVAGLNDIIAIAGGGLNGYALKNDGTVWSWGVGQYGALGNNDPSLNDALTPVQVEGLSQIVRIASNSGKSTGSTYALDSGGTVWAWGWGEEGDLGDGHDISPGGEWYYSTFPVRVRNLSRVTDVAAHGGGGYAVRSDGTAWAWGSDFGGLLGRGDTMRSDSSVPIQISGLTNTARIFGGYTTGFAFGAVAASFKYVALGDSYSSGEGVDPYFRDGLTTRNGVTIQPGNIDNRCHRSTRAYAEYVRRPGDQESLYVQASGGGKSGSGKRINKYGSDQNVRSANGVEWGFFACSGATIANVKKASQGGFAQLPTDRYKELGPQLDYPFTNAATDLVTVTIGGNDAGFADLLLTCYKSACMNKKHDDFRAAALARIDGLDQPLRQLYTSIKASAPNARIIVLGYPMVLPASPRAQSCRALKPFRGEFDFLRSLNVKVNQEIKDAAAAAGVVYLDTTAAFERYEVCGLDGEWINGPSATYKVLKITDVGIRIRVDDESFHPKVKGQQVLAQVINDYLAAVQ